MSDNPHEHHHHHGHHVHGDLSHENASQANLEHFNMERARQYDDIPGAKEMVGKIAAAMKEQTSFVDKDVLDFACGTGLVSRNVAADAKSVLGVDISPNMLEVYMEKIKEAGFETKAKSLSIDLLSERGQKALEGQKFDIVACSMAYHHFADPSKVTAALAEVLSPGGSLLIADFKPHSGEKSEDKAADLALMPEKLKDGVVAHHAGYSEDDVKKLFIDGGLELESYKHAVSFDLWEKYMEVFVAKGVKKA